MAGGKVSKVYLSERTGEVSAFLTRASTGTGLEIGFTEVEEMTGATWLIEAEVAPAFFWP